MAKSKPSEPDKRSTDERITDLENSLKKQTRLTALAAVIAAILGSGGVAGILTVTSQKSLHSAEARLKEAEASSKELEVACARHEKSIDSLQKIIDAFKEKGDSAKADALTKLLLQQEAEFQEFCRDMNIAMQGLWHFGGSEAAVRCQAALRKAEKASHERQEMFAALLK